MYRKASESELEDIRNRLDKYILWMQIRDLAHDVFGPTVSKINIETYGEYNDEGGTDIRIESIAAFDVAGVELTHDYATAFWVSALADVHLDDEYDDYALDTLHERFYDVKIDDHYDIKNPITVDTPPADVPELYILVADA